MEFGEKHPKKNPHKKQTPLVTSLKQHISANAFVKKCAAFKRDPYIWFDNMVQIIETVVKERGSKFSDGIHD